LVQGLTRDHPSEKKASRPAFFVPVNRLSEVEEQRSKLPIFMEEQRIMEAIKENEVVVICGGRWLITKL